MTISFRDRDIISITDFSREEILHLCEAGKRMYELEKSGGRDSLRHALRYRSLASLFYEPSTRTRTSFNTSMRELGGRYDGFSGTEGTAVMKSETVRDTVAMMCANHFDVLVMRHPRDGTLQWAADCSGVPVINGGDGKNEHPTQAMLDVLTLYVLNQGKLDGLRVGFGRAARLFDMMEADGLVSAASGSAEGMAKPTAEESAVHCPTGWYRYSL